MADTPNLRDALALARRLGLVVDTVHRTGEIRVTFPDSGFTSPFVTVNNRRKSAPKELLKRLRRQQRLNEERATRLRIPSPASPIQNGTPETSERSIAECATDGDRARERTARP